MNAPGRLASLAMLPALVAFAARVVFAQAAAPSPLPTFSTADCTLVSVAEISQIVGYAVAAPDESSRASGICFYVAPGMSADGSASYTLVDDERVQQRRWYFTVLAHRCGNVAPGTPNEFECKSFVELSQAKTLDEYFAARTDLPNNESIHGLGDAAVASGGALYVKRGGLVFEVVVRRGDAIDLARSTALAKLLLARTRQTGT